MCPYGQGYGCRDSGRETLEPKASSSGSLWVELGRGDSIPRCAFQYLFEPHIYLHVLFTKIKLKRKKETRAHPWRDPELAPFVSGFNFNDTVSLELSHFLHL